MTTPPYANGQEPQRLQRQYFSYPSTWRFNSPDFYLFYYALGALLSVLLILFLLMLLAGNRQASQAPAPSQITRNNPPTLPPTATEVPAAALSSAAPSATPTPSQSQSQAAPASEDLISAEQQPSYALRAEAYGRLRDNPQLSRADRLRATAAYQRYNGLALQSQNRLEQALDGLGKDRYTVSIRQLQALIKEGEIHGDVYLQAQESLPKAYLKKIEYFMLNGQISKASHALKEAKAAGIENEAIADYEVKIRNLIKVSK